MSILENYPQRQIHLDFHTSPFIDDVGVDFDAETFAATMAEAHVNSVTIFGKCHHGMCYYPTKAGVMHPALKGRDLLGEMIEALHRRGIRCPIYTTLAWEEDAAQRFPEWRQITADGFFAENFRTVDEKNIAPGSWKYMNWIHPDYMDYTEAHVRELLDNYEVDGFFFDIFKFHDEACWSEASVRFREEHGLTARDVVTKRLFEAKAQEVFAGRFTKMIQEKRPDATIYYNHSYDLKADGVTGARHLGRFTTHYELESLPSGFWGYQHFPRQARGVLHLGKPWIGMTGRFQKMWGDFGGIKPQPALEYECFRSQALGGGNSVGDQLPPRGVLEPAAYRLIQAVYAQCEAAEPFYAGSQPVHQAGVVSANSIHSSAEDRPSLSDEGLMLILTESRYEAEMVDEFSDLSELDLLILPDTVVLTQKMASQIESYLTAGGKLLLSGKSGFREDGKWGLPSLELRPGRQVALYPTYWKAREHFWPEGADSLRVIYAPGYEPVLANGGWEPLVDRQLPYFKRNDLKFCSHFQTPPRAEVEAAAAVMASRQAVWFGDPVFREYRQTGNLACQEVVTRALERLIGKPWVQGDLPKTVQVYARRRGRSLLLTLLHYIPQRKSLDIDIVDAALPLGGYSLSFSRSVDELRVFGADSPLEKSGPGVWTLPTAYGRILLEAPGFFRGNGV